jgi:hypothetical protein
MHILRISEVRVAQNEFPTLGSVNDIYICMFICDIQRELYGLYGWRASQCSSKFGIRVVLLRRSAVISINTCLLYPELAPHSLASDTHPCHVID